MLKAYFDESADEREERVFGIGGYIGTEEAWSQFEPLWGEALKRHGVKNGFHMVDFSARRGEFLGWDDSRRIPLIDDLVEAILRVSIYGFNVAVSLSDFRELFPLDKPKAPYFLCFQMCVEQMLEWAKVWREEQVAFIFDQKKEFAPTALRLFQKIKEMDWEGKERMGTLAFEGREKFLPLQAADLLAYEARKVADDELTGTGRPIRISLQRLALGNLYGHFYNRDELLKLRVSVAEQRMRSSI